MPDPLYNDDPIARDATITTSTTTSTPSATDADTDPALEETPEMAESRAQIEATRAHMASTVDAIREKLSPAHMVDEAKDAVKDAALDVAHGVVDKAKELAGSALGAVSSAAETVVAKASDAVDSVKEVLHIGGDATSPDYPTAATTALSEPTRSTNAIYPNEPDYAPRRHPFDTAAEAVSPYLNTGLATGAKIVDTIKLNPLPALLIGVGIGWLLMSARRQSTGGVSFSSDAPTALTPASYAAETYGVYQSAGEPSRVDQAKAALSSAKDTVADYAADAKDKVVDVAGQAKETVTDFAGQAADKASDLASTAKDKATDLASSAQAKASDLTDQAKSKASDLAAQASDLASQAKDKASDLAAQAKGKASDLAAAAQTKASDVVGTVGVKANELGTAAKAQGQVAVSSVDSFVHENPLAAGAIALAVGVAVGLAIPSTTKEHELIGPTRDRLADQAGAKASEMVGKVQTVAGAALDVAKDNLGQAKEDLTHQLSDTLQQTKDALGSAKTAVTDAVKSEAQNQGLTSAPEATPAPA